MTLHFIEGGAGTGKTTTLTKRLGQVLGAQPLLEPQRVLALTKMHGGRRRVHERLGAVPGLSERFECVTIDSFARRVVRRWRSLARVLTGRPAPTEFAEFCDQAGRLLEESCVQKWIASSFPIVVVDELQDSKDGQLRILAALSARCICIAAGDPFQDLDGEAACSSIEWARQQGPATVLTTTHRTSKSGLLSAATSLREARAVEVDDGFSIVGVAGFGLGAYEAAKKIARWWKQGNIALIAPVSAARSKFVRQVVKRINSEPPLGKQWKVGPFRVPWEAALDEQIAHLCDEIGVVADDHAVVRADALSLNGQGRVRIFRDWIERQRRLRGRVEFTAAELREAARQVVHQSRTYAQHRERALSAMLVHQAKNREFDRVIVLWPYEVSGNDDRKRRLAYNAITRARHEALVIVQGEARVRQSPFVPNAFLSSGSGGRRTRRASLTDNNADL